MATLKMMQILTPTIPTDAYLRVVSIKVRNIQAYSVPDICHKSRLISESKRKEGKTSLKLPFRVGDRIFSEFDKPEMYKGYA